MSPEIDFKRVNSKGLNDFGLMFLSKTNDIRFPVKAKPVHYVACLPARVVWLYGYCITIYSNNRTSSDFSRIKNVRRDPWQRASPWVIIGKYSQFSTWSNIAQQHNFIYITQVNWTTTFSGYLPHKIPGWITFGPTGPKCPWITPL